jgi:putative flippase GtrA
MIKKLLKYKTDNSFIELFRYTFVGGIAFVADFGSLFILTDIFNIYYLISAALAFLIGSVINYSLSISWVFSKRTLRSRQWEFGIFIIIGVVGLGINEFIIWFFTEHLHFHYLVSKIFSAGIVLMWNFSARKFLLFR